MPSRCQVISQSNDYPVQSRLSLQWRHNGRDSVSNHQPHDCLLNSLFKLRSKKTSKLRVTGLCAGNSPGTQMASNEENVSIWWRHHVCPGCGSVILAMHSVGCWKTATLIRKQPNIQRGVGFSVKIHWNGNVVFLIIFHHWLHWKLSKWQLPVQPVIKISSKRRHFRDGLYYAQSVISARRGPPHPTPHPHPHPLPPTTPRFSA